MAKSKKAPVSEQKIISRAKKSKCTICGGMFPPEEWVVIKSKKYCNSCAKAVYEEIEQKKYGLCSVCGKKNLLKEMVKRGGKYYCKECIEEEKYGYCAGCGEKTLLKEMAKYGGKKYCPKCIQEKRSGYCAECGKKVLLKEMIKYGGANYCKECAKKKDEAVSKEARNYKELMEYISVLYHHNNDIIPYIASQIKRLKIENGWKTESILCTLKYAFEFSGSPPILNKDYGIKGIVERYYVAAKRYYTELYSKKMPMEDIMEILTLPPKEIVMNRSAMIRQERRMTEKRKNLIYGPKLDMNSIIDDAEFYNEEELYIEEPRKQEQN